MLDAEVPMCGGTISSSNAELRYPYSRNYKDCENCIWVINPRVPIKLTFHIFDLEGCCDFLVVKDPGRADVRYSGRNIIPPPIISSDGNVRLHFTTDYSIEGAGFWLTISGSKRCYFSFKFLVLRKIINDLFFPVTYHSFPQPSIIPHQLYSR